MLSSLDIPSSWPKRASTNMPDKKQDPIGFGEQMCQRLIFNRDLINKCKDHLPPTFYRDACVHDYEQNGYSDDAMRLITLALIDRCQFISAFDYCPNLCSLNGDCVNGVCVCNTGWKGLDCSTPASVVVSTSDGGSAIGIVAGIAGGIAGGVAAVLAAAALAYYLWRRRRKGAEESNVVPLDDLGLPLVGEVAVEMIPDAGSFIVQNPFSSGMTRNPLHLDNDLNDDQVYGL